MEHSNTSKMILAAGIVVALAVGSIAGYAMGKNMTDAKDTQSTSQSTTMTKKTADLRVAFNNLLREHVSSSLTVTRNIVDGVSADKLQGSEDAQTANAVAIATAVGGIYGDDAKAAIAAPFVDHVAQSNNYAKAVAASDMNAQTSSLAALRDDLHKVADVFHSVIPSLTSDTLYTALNAHENLLNQSIEEYKAGNFAKSYELENEALTQISGGAEALSTGIVASKPDMFK